MTPRKNLFVLLFIGFSRVGQIVHLSCPYIESSQKLQLNIVLSFPFIILLYCESYECIYISPICDVGTSYYFSVEIKRLGILYFSLFTWYQSHKRKPNFWVIVFHSDLLLRRRISFSPQQPPQPPPSVPPATFREAHLRPKTTYFEAHADDLPAGGNPAGKQKLTRRHARPFSRSVPSTRRRVSAREGACFLLR